MIGLVCCRVKKGLFLTRNEITKKKKRISREKRNLGVLGGKAGRLRRRPRSFAGTREGSGISSENFLRRSMRMLRKILRFGVLVRAFYAF